MEKSIIKFICKVKEGDRNKEEKKTPPYILHLHHTQVMTPLKRAGISCCV